MTTRKCFASLGFLVIATVGFFFILYECALTPTEQVPVSVQKTTTYSANSYIRKPIQPSIYTHHAAGPNVPMCDDLLAQVRANSSIYINESNIYGFYDRRNMGACNFGDLVGSPCYGSSKAIECQPRYNYVDPNGNYFFNTNGQVVYINVSTSVEMYLSCSVSVVYQYEGTVYNTQEYGYNGCPQQGITNSVQVMYYSPSRKYYPFSEEPNFWTKQDKGTIAFLVFLSLAMSLIPMCIFSAIIVRIDFQKKFASCSKVNHGFNLKKYIRWRFPSRFSKMDSNSSNTEMTQV